MFKCKKMNGRLGRGGKGVLEYKEGNRWETLNQRHQKISPKCGQIDVSMEIMSNF